MSNLTKVSIGIAAYNEEGNIRLLIKSILSQKTSFSNIVEILIILDGCTDNTFREISLFNDKRIKVINSCKRMGKTARINQLSKIFKGTFLVLIDADVVLGNLDAIDNLVLTFKKSNKIGLVSAAAKPVSNGSLIERAVLSSIQPYLEYAESINKGSNIYACKGVLLAINREYAKTLNIPAKVFAYDTYLFFDALSKGYKFAYSKNSEVFYRLPQTLSEHIKQNTRFNAAAYSLAEYFGVAIQNEYGRHKQELYKFQLMQLLKDPVFSLLIFLINLYTKYRAKARSRIINAKWEIIGSTKKGIRYAKS